MPPGPACHPFDTIARKWFALAVRRRDYFLELMHSGRWTRYYDEESFLERMRDVMQAVENWRALAGAAQEPEDDDMNNKLRPAA